MPLVRFSAHTASGDDDHDDDDDDGDDNIDDDDRAATMTKPSGVPAFWG